MRQAPNPFLSVLENRCRPPIQNRHALHVQQQPDKSEILRLLRHNANNPQKKNLQGLQLSLNFVEVQHLCAKQFLHPLHFHAAQSPCLDHNLNQEKQLPPHASVNIHRIAFNNFIYQKFFTHLSNISWVCAISQV